MDEATSRCGTRESPCGTPGADQVTFPLSIGGDGVPCANDSSLKISGQTIMYLRRRTSRRMELKAFLTAILPRMYMGDALIILAA